MSARFTAEEDMAMWRFAMEEHPGYGKVNMWELFKKRTGSERTAQSLYFRFFQILLANLSKTKFHVETKLKLCQKYVVKVGDEFLKELETDAEVELNEDRTVNSYQLKPHCPKNRDLEMDDEELMGITSLIPKWKRWSSEEEAEIWSYVFGNLEEYTRGGETFWKELVVKMNWDRTPTALINRFLYSMVPNLHKKNFPIGQKLELYKRCQVPVDKKYLKTLKEHAELKIDENRCITAYKMKTNHPEKRKNAEETKEEAKKAKRVIPEEPSDDQDEDEDMVFDDIVPETDTRRAKKVREESPEPASEAQDDDVILDNVVDRGWTNSDMILRGPPKIEVDDGGDEPAVEERDHIVNFNPKAEMFDEMNVEYAEMVHGDGGLGFGVGTRRSDDWNERIVNQRSEDHSDLMTKMLETMQRMEQKMEIQEAAHMKVLSEMKKDLEASHKEDMREVKKALETSQHQVVKLSKTVASMQSEVKMIRNKIDGIPEDASTRKKYLLNAKRLVSLLDSPELASVEQRIDTALQNLQDNDDNPIPMKALGGILEAELTLFGC